MDEQATRRVAQIHKWIVRLGNIRDGLLVGGAVLYGFGYIAFSVFAWLHQLGPVPGIEAQYFIAGIPVVFVVLIGIAIAMAFHRFQTVTWSARYAAASRGAQRAMTGAVVVTFATFLALAMHRKRPDIGWQDVTIILVTIFVLPLMRWPYDKSGPDRMDLLFQRTSTLFSTAYILIFAMLAGVFYLRFGYERIPQALGGGEPRPAILSLNTEMIPPTTLYLLIGKVPGKGEKLAESMRLLVFVDTKDALLVAPQEGQAGRPLELFEISRSSITSVRWVE